MQTSKLCALCGDELNWDGEIDPSLHHNHENGKLIGFVHPRCNQLEGTGKTEKAYTFRELTYVDPEVSDVIIDGKWSNGLLRNQLADPTHVEKLQALQGKALKDWRRRALRRKVLHRSFDQLIPIRTINIEMARAIRKEHATGLVSKKELSKKYAIYESAVGNILQNRIWKESGDGE